MVSETIQRLLLNNDFEDPKSRISWMRVKTRLFFISFIAKLSMALRQVVGVVVAMVW